MTVQIMVYIYMAVCVSMILFNIAYTIVYNRKDGTGKKRDKYIRERIKKQVFDVKKGMTISPEEINKITKKCDDMWNLAAWDDEITSLYVFHREAVEKYIENMLDMFVKLSYKMKKREPVQQAHFAYIVYKYRIFRYEQCKSIVYYMLELVKSHNLYCRENALKVLYTYGDVELVCKAMEYIGQSNTFHHEKLLVDGLLTFQGDKFELMNHLIQGRKQKKIFMQRVILNYIRFGSGLYRDLFLNILKDENEDDECRYIAIRYFGRHPDEEAKEILIDIVTDPENQKWEYPAIAVTSLGSYDDEETINVLKQCLRNANWYIRHNAAVSLDKLKLDDSEYEDVLNGDDKFAREVLEYRMDMSKYMHGSIV